MQKLINQAAKDRARVQELEAQIPKVEQFLREQTRDLSELQIKVKSLTEALEREAWNYVHISLGYGSDDLDDDGYDEEDNYIRPISDEMYSVLYAVAHVPPHWEYDHRYAESYAN